MGSIPILASESNVLSQCSCSVYFKKLEFILITFTCEVSSQPITPGPRQALKWSNLNNYQKVVQSFTLCPNLNLQKKNDYTKHFYNCHFLNLQTLVSIRR